MRMIQEGEYLFFMLLQLNIIAYNTTGFQNSKKNATLHDVVWQRESINSHLLLQAWFDFVFMNCSYSWRKNEAESRRII